MRNWGFSILILALFVFGYHSKADSIQTVEVDICTNSANQINPSIFDDLIIWQDDRNGNWDIYAYNLETEMEYEICTADGNQINPSIEYGSILYEFVIVWQDDRNGDWDIYGYQFDRYDYISYGVLIGSEIEICTDPCDQINPITSTPYFFWQDSRNGNWDIYGKDISNVNDPNMVICDDPADQENPAIGLGMIVWQDSRGGNWDIYGYDVGDENDLAVYIGDGNQTIPSIGVRGVTWRDDRNGNPDIYAMWGLIGIAELYEVAICVDSNEQTNSLGVGYPADYAYWQDNRNGDWDIYGYRIFNPYAGEEFVICSQEGDQVSPAIFDAATGNLDNIVVWQDNRNGNWDIYGAYVYEFGECGDGCGRDICFLEIFDDELFSGTNEGMSGTVWWERIIYDDGGVEDYEVTLTSSCAYNDEIDAWHVYTPEFGGPVTISTEGSSLDTVLSVYNSCDFDDYERFEMPTELVCNDDYSLASTASKVFLDVVKGKDYHVRVSGFDNQTGEYNILVTRGAQSDPIRSDLNGDGIVDFHDFIIFSSEWLMSEPE